MLLFFHEQRCVENLRGQSTNYSILSTLLIPSDATVNLLLASPRENFSFSLHIITTSQRNRNVGRQKEGPRWVYTRIFLRVQQTSQEYGQPYAIRSRNTVTIHTFLDFSKSSSHETFVKYQRPRTRRRRTKKKKSFKYFYNIAFRHTKEENPNFQQKCQFSFTFSQVTKPIIFTFLSRVIRDIYHPLHSRFRIIIVS